MSLSTKIFCTILCITFLYQFLIALPVIQEKKISPQRFADEEFDKLTANESINEVNSNDHGGPNGNVAEELGIEYNRYLNEVVEALESDPEFRKKLENASEADIRSGKIAQELEYVNHQVRSKLDELKRTELDRLRELAKRQYELSEGKSIPEIPGHIDHKNPHSFEINDLHKLIVQVTNDLAEADRKRRELFKEYELQKRYERDQKLALMTDEEKEAFLKKEAEEIESRKHDIDQADVHHPGSKKQLEEVWQEQDHMGNQEFNPKAFFVMHDLDGNHMWDEEEVKMLFLKELDKLYKTGMPQNDLMERAEEMERMREHVFKEADVNRDRLISWEEFLEMTRRQEFNNDPGWKPIDQEQVYSQAEMEAYERQRQAEVDRLVKEGRIPAVPPQYVQYGHPPQYHPGQPIPQHPNMPQHVPVHQYNPGDSGIQYVPGNVPPVQVSPQHYQAMHQPNNIPQNNFHVNAQQPNFNSVPPNQQQKVQYNQQPNQGQNQGQYVQQPNQGQNQGQFVPNNVNQAQYAQNNVNQAQYGQNNLNQAQYAQNNLNQAQYGQNNLNQAQYAQNNVNQGQKSQNNVNQAQYVQNNNIDNNINHGQYDQNNNQQQHDPIVQHPNAPQQPYVNNVGQNNIGQTNQGQVQNQNTQGQVNPNIQGQLNSNLGQGQVNQNQNVQSQIKSNSQGQPPVGQLYHSEGDPHYVKQTNNKV